MKPPTFLEGAGVALVASIGGGVLFVALTTAFTAGIVLRVLIALLGGAYVVYLLSRSGERVGRIAVLTLWLVAAAAAWLISPSLPVYLLLHVGMVWVIRSLYYYSSLSSSLADLALSGISAAAAVWAAVETGSAFLSVWCFFLTQAAFVLIPAALGRTGRARDEAVGEDHFEQAHRAAEAALRRFSSTP